MCTRVFLFLCGSTATTGLCGDLLHPREPGVGRLRRAVLVPPSSLLDRALPLPPPSLALPFPLAAFASLFCAASAFFAALSSFWARAAVSSCALRSIAAAMMSLMGVGVEGRGGKAVRRRRQLRRAPVLTTKIGCGWCSKPTRRRPDAAPSGPGSR